MVTVAPVDPAGAAASGAALLRRAWAPPALHYTEAYLRWQLGFPPADGIGAVAVRAEAGSEWVGFAAATPRRVEVAGTPIDAHLVSFVAVAPEARGSGLGHRLYAVLLDRLVAAGAQAVITFGLEGSVGLSLLVRAYEAAGFRTVDLGEYPSLGMVIPRTATAREASPPPGLPASGPADLLASAPTEEQWRHYLTDPRGTRWLGLPDRGTLTGRGGLAVLAERATTRGVEPFACLTNLFGGPFDAADLAILAEGLAGFGPPGTVATLPNPEGLPLEEARSRGLRRLAVNYCGKLFTRPDWTGSLPRLARTTVEVA